VQETTDAALRSLPAAQNWPLSCSVGVASFLARLLDGPSASSRAACSSLRHTSLALLKGQALLAHHMTGMLIHASNNNKHTCAHMNMFAQKRCFACGRAFIFEQTGLPPWLIREPLLQDNPVICTRPPVDLCVLWRAGWQDPRQRLQPSQSPLERRICRLLDLATGRRAAERRVHVHPRDCLHHTMHST